MNLKKYLKLTNPKGEPTFLFKALQFLIRALAATWRFSFAGPKIQEPAVTVFWHDQIYPLSKGMADTNSIVLVSPSRDGAIVINLVASWKHEFIRGSSMKNSRDTLRVLIATAKKRKVFVTPDGPRGPRHQLKLGALLAAQKAQAPFYMLKAQGKGYRIKKSWDKFFIPYPFAKIKIITSVPQFIPKHYKKEELQAFAEQCEAWLES